MTKQKKSIITTPYPTSERIRKEMGLTKAQEAKMKKLMAEHFEEPPTTSDMMSRIAKIFEVIDDDILNYHLGADDMAFDIQYEKVTFDKLAKLSKLLGTRKINFAGIRHESGCDTCGWGGGTWVTIRCDEVDI